MHVPYNGEISNFCGSEMHACAMPRAIPKYSHLRRVWLGMNGFVQATLKLSSKGAPVNPEELQLHQKHEKILFLTALLLFAQCKKNYW
jgi:hypothetical protein